MPNVPAFRAEKIKSYPEKSGIAFYVYFSILENAVRTAWIVLSISSSVWAVDKNTPSN
jgi:hypothetical protein